MVKTLLIISPHFPPVNAADMHRVRQSLPYFRQMGWEPVVITVDESCIESYSTDPLLSLTIPADIEVHKVKALHVKHTRKLGLGSLSMRSYWHIRRKGNELLLKRKFDLVYFSTTAFHVMALGPVWKKKFKVPFVLDIQDPWRNDFYLDKPRHERPPKFFIAYSIDKYLEKKTIPFADGIISVSQGYCTTFSKRYPQAATLKYRVIPFGVAPVDVEIMRKHVVASPHITFEPGKINIVYVGRGGHDMAFAVSILFAAYKKGIEAAVPEFSKIHFWFAGTSYAPAGAGKKTIQPIAEAFGVGHAVTEITDRLPYFESLYVLDKADMLFMPGSTDINYTASKIYPYLLLQKKLLAVFNENSSVVTMLQQLHYGMLVSFDHTKHAAGFYVDDCFGKLQALLKMQDNPVLDEALFMPHLAISKTKEQVDFFNEVLNEYKSNR
jgi:hypothetical protein